MLTLQVLDNILSILSQTSKDKIYFKIIEHELYQNTLFKRQLSELIIKKSLEKLISEKYVLEIKAIVFNELLKRDIEETTYEITWEGHFFISQGGYSGQYFRENEEKERIKRVEKEQLANARKIEEQSKKMTSLTRVLVFLTAITSLYYLMEICRFLYPHIRKYF